MTRSGAPHRSPTPRLAACAIVTVTLLAGGRASAQNADPFFFGDEAALGSGAVVASGRDSGAFWYNPAGFGGLKRGLVSASASTFGIRLRTVPNALRLRVGGQDSGIDLSSADIISVPNAVVAATQIGEKSALAGGLLMTERDLRSAFGATTDQPGRSLDGAPLVTSQRLDIQADTAKYHVGAAFATQLLAQLRLGAALYGTYTKAAVGASYAFGATNTTEPSTERVFVLAAGRETSSAIGVTASLGAQYEVTPKVAAGLTVRLPEVALSQSVEGGAVIGTGAVSTTDPGVADLVREPAQRANAAGTFVAPTRVLAGVAYALGPPQSWVEFGVDFAHGLPASELADARQPAVNGRVGVRYMLSPAWIVGGGVFTDFATRARLGELVVGDRVDYYGLTAGVSKRTPLSLRQDPSPEALVLVTTFSLRSSIGFGQARAATIDLDDPNAQRDDRSDVTYFELMPYLGSAVVF
ncbi:MAG: hypothetical protein KIT84_36845 [Labilithrix sp.]|nr:hypothetical protein [Labilithrix sp.]MCW5816625.1 hypothetical protein [Labilithrix sp.]